MSKKNNKEEYQSQDDFTDIENLDDATIAELENESQDAATQDFSKENNKVNLRSMLSKGMSENECLMYNCSLRDKHKKLEEELKIAKQKINSQTADNETLRNAIQKNIPEEERRALVLQAIKDGFIQEQKNNAIAKDQDIETLRSESIKQRSEISMITKERDELLKTFDIDAELSKKWGNLKLVEKRTAAIASREREIVENVNKLEQKEFDLRMRVLKYSKIHNDKLAEINHLIAIEKQAKSRMKGTKLKPENPEGFFKKLLNKNKQCQTLT